MGETDANLDDTDEAKRIVISYPADLSDWGRFQVEKRPFRAYLTKTLGRVAAGDEREVFVGVGCCGNTLDVPLRIEAVEGGPEVTRETGIEYTVREACGLQGGWRVQSADGPTA
jgi:hypothetical protein